MENVNLPVNTIILHFIVASMNLMENIIRSHIKKDAVNASNNSEVQMKSKELMEEVRKLEKKESLCAYCKNDVAECSSVPEFSGDEVIECNAFEIVSNNEMWFLKRCRNTLRLCFKGDTKVLIDFNKCDGDSELNSFTNILKELFKTY